MTTPETNDVMADEPMDVMQWLDSNRQFLTIVVVAIIIGGSSWWIFSQSRHTKEVNASKALFLAKQSIGAQNQALAKSDLEKLVARYAGTGAGSEGALLLAQMDFDQAKYQEGITVLENASKSAPQPMESEIRSLLGDGYLSMKNPAAAAKEYEKAADLSGRELERASQKGRAARAYSAAGDTAKSRQIWAELVLNAKNPSVAAEARVRLGELTARSAKKG